MSWKVIINNTRNKHSNWFLRHKKRLGSLQWLTPKLLFLSLCISIISILWQYHSPIIAHIMDSIIFFYSIPIIFILYYRLPVISRTDKYLHLDTEMRYILILLASEWTCYTAGSVINRIVLQQIDTSSKSSESSTESISSYYDEMVFLFILSWIGVVFAFCTLLIITKWTMYKSKVQITRYSNGSNRNRNRTKRRRVRIHRRNMSNSSVRTISTMSPTSITTAATTPSPSPGVQTVHTVQSPTPSPTPGTPGSTRISQTFSNSKRFKNIKISGLSSRGSNLKLIECLQCNDGFSCFMNHLMSEFNHECLLSVIEFIQFRNHCARKALHSNESNPHFSQFSQFSSNMNSVNSGSFGFPLRISSGNLMMNSNDHIVSHSASTSSSFGSNGGDECGQFAPDRRPSNQPSDRPSERPSERLSERHSLPPDHRPQLTLSMTSYSGTFRSHSASTAAKRREILSVEFPECVPMSFIVFRAELSEPVGAHSLDEPLSKEDVLMACKERAFLLFQKYIHCDRRCEYEINIDYQMKMGLIQLMSNGELDGINSFGELSVVFDECILEMYDLMCQSFKRFKRTPQFAVLDRKIFSKLT